ncbi:MAG: hypothetical protein CTY15_04850 [Methylocystis sp.]|nr:MAG: hypothetical protein CTY15_04850 [Methylocystis sp.]
MRFARGRSLPKHSGAARRSPARPARNAPGIVAGGCLRQKKLAPWPGALQAYAADFSHLLSDSNFNKTVQQYLMQSEANPAVGWGFFAQAGISDGNPNPIKWSVIAGLGGNNLAPGREADVWGVGYMHYGFSRHLLRALDAFGIEHGDESGVEAFYNVALTPWLRLTGDLQFIQPWNPAANRATIGALRLQTKF